MIQNNCEDMREKLKVIFRCEYPREKGYLEEHTRLTRQLFEVIGEREFEKRADSKPGWEELAQQACEDYARYLILTSDEDPPTEDAKNAVIGSYERFLKNPQGAAASRNQAIH